MGRSLPYIYIYILINKRKRQIEGEALCSIPLWDDRDWAPFSITGPSTRFLLFYLWMIGWCVFCSQAHCLLNKKNKEKYILYILVYIYIYIYIHYYTYAQCTHTHISINMNMHVRLVLVSRRTGGRVQLPEHLTSIQSKWRWTSKLANECPRNCKS